MWDDNLPKSIVLFGFTQPNPCHRHRHLLRTIAQTRVKSRQLHTLDLYQINLLCRWSLYSRYRMKQNEYTRIHRFCAYVFHAFITSSVSGKSPPWGNQISCPLCLTLSSNPYHYQCETGEGRGFSPQHEKHLHKCHLPSNAELVCKIREGQHI